MNIINILTLIRLHYPKSPWHNVCLMLSSQKAAGAADLNKQQTLCHSDFGVMQSHDGENVNYICELAASVKLPRSTPKVVKYFSFVSEENFTGEASNSRFTAESPHVY